MSATEILPLVSGESAAERAEPGAPEESGPLPLLPDPGPSGSVESVVLPGMTLADWKMTRATRRRRSVPIMGWVGLNGQGKTLGALRDTIPSLLAGRRVLSTVPLLDPHTGNPHPLYVPFRSWSQLPEFFNGDIFMDEITGIMDSRDGTAGMPKAVRRLLPQMRRRNVMIRWTGIDWDNSDRRLRQVTQAVALCKGYMPDRGQARSDGGDTALAMWLPNRWFSVITYDAQTLSQSDDSKMMHQDAGSSGQRSRRRVKVLSREWYYGPRSGVFPWYNTLESVSAVDASCVHCGGRVPDKVCKGHD